MKRVFFGALALAVSTSTAYADDLAEAVAADYSYVFDLYRHFRENPELSFKESESAARMAAELEALGFDVTTGVGDKWVRNKAKADAGEVLDGVGGHGLVAVLENY